MNKIKLGISGTGYVCTNFYNTFHNHPNIQIPIILTRRNLKLCGDFPNPEILTNSIEELVDKSDCIYECSGDPVHAANVIHQAFLARKPVITTNSEFHVTCGSYFVDQGILTEAAGDQPGALAELHYRAQQMGFKILAYVNMKGFLNHTPKLEEMHYWGKRNGISLASVTSFTDGTKIQFEQALTANAFGATLAKTEMLGLNEKNLDKAANEFAKTAKRLKHPISDYVIYPGAPHAVFVVLEHHPREQAMLQYVKMGSGPFYLLKQEAILLHLEIPHTLFELYEHKKILLNNSEAPSIQVAAIAKKPLKKGVQITEAMGGFEVRGIAVKIAEHPDILPVGLAKHARLLRDIAPGDMIQWDDVEIEDSLAKKAWLHIKAKIGQNPLAVI